MRIAAGDRDGGCGRVCVSGFLAVASRSPFGSDKLVEKPEEVGPVLADPADRGHPSRLPERVGDGVGRRAIAAVGAGEQCEEVLPVEVSGVAQSVIQVDRFQQFAGGEVGVVQREQLAPADEPSPAGVRAEVGFEAVDALLGERPFRLAESGTVRAEVERRRRVGVSGPVVDTDAPEASAVGTLDGARLVVRPSRAAPPTLPFAADLHGSHFGTSGVKGCGRGDRIVWRAEGSSASTRYITVPGESGVMSWHAVEAVDDAVEATRRFLFPFGLVRWAKLALLVLLMGGGANVGVSVPVAPDARIGGIAGLFGSRRAGAETASAAAEFDVVASDLLAGVPGRWQVVAVTALAVGAVIGLSVISLSLRLAFYDALRTNTIRLWRPFLGRLRQAAGLFVASVLLWSIIAVPIGLTILVAVAPGTTAGWEPVDSFAAAVGSLSVGATVAAGLLAATTVLFAAIALRLTYEFVVPTMAVEGTGVLAGWRRVWCAVRGEWPQVVVYLAVHFFIAIGTAVVEGIAVAVVGFAIAAVAGSALLLAAVPLGGLGALAGTTAGVGVVVIVAIIAVATLVALTLPVSVVTRSYLIAYEVTTLDGIDPELALLHRDLDPASADAE